MRVALFFDGKNFFRSLEHLDPTLEIDYDRLALWVSQEAGGPQGTFAGAYYYTGYSPGSEPRGIAFGKFLDGLEFRRGFFVRREPRVSRVKHCRHCGQVEKFRTEKRVDARLVADMIHFAAVNSYDCAVLFSGDQDLVPGVEAVAALGKHVYVATWRRKGLSPELRTRCFGEVELSSGIPHFKSGRKRRGSNGSPPTAVDVPAESSLSPDLEQCLEEITAACRQFTKSGGQLSEWYFLQRWRGKPSFPRGTALRKQFLDELVDAGWVERTQFTDRKGRTAEGLRLKEADVPACISPRAV